MNEIQAIVAAAQQAEQDGKTAVLATVVDVEGSSYRRPGARMLVTEDGWQAGSISGGCLEGDIVKRGLWLTQNGPALLTYDTTDDDDIVFGVGLGCRGVVSVFLERVTASSIPLAFLADCIERRTSGVLATKFTGENFGAHFMLNSGGEDDLTAAMQSVLASGQSATQTLGASKVFFEVVRPPIPLVIFGAGHDAMPLVTFAKTLGWHVTVCDGRPSYATSSRFPEADAVILCLPEAVGQIPLSADTLAVVMTHNYLTDLALLRALLSSPVRYLGLLGPKSRAEQLLADLREENVSWTDAQAGRLHAPVGLDIGADTPESVALAMLAEMQATLANRDGGKLRERAAPIHPERKAESRAGGKPSRERPGTCASVL